MKSIEIRAATLAAAAILLGGCATVVAGTSQTIEIATEPEGASCALSREGDGSLGAVVPTPGKINVARRKNPIQVACTKEGYEETTDALRSKFSGATIGNVLLGGIVGLAIDAASGANNTYPEKNIIIMTPTSFPNAQARDEHYAKVAERLKESAKKDIETQTSNCGGSVTELCRIEIRKIEEARDKALQSLDQKRLAAKIG